MSDRLRSIGWLLAAIALGAASTFVVQHVRAAGIPVAGTLTYTGQLENQDGTPVAATTKNIDLLTYNADTGGSPIADCSVMSSAVSLTRGQFQIALPDKCPAVVRANSDLWIEVRVDGAPLGRTKLGAVPYAVEAEHAVNADMAATATAGLNDRIAILESQLATVLQAMKPRSAARCHKNNGDLWDYTSGAKVTSMSKDAKGYYMMCDVRDFDVLGELQSDGYTFKAAEAGYYVAACGAKTDQGGYILLQLEASGEGVAGTLNSTGVGTYFNVASIVRLEAGGTVRCALVNWTGDVRKVDASTDAPWDQGKIFLSVARL